MAILLVGIAGAKRVLRVHVVPGGAPLLLSNELLKDFGCHSDLGRGHMFFQKKLRVPALVTSKQSPHLLLLQTTFGPQGHKIPDEILPRLNLTNVQSTVPLATARNRIKYICGSPQHRTAGHQRLTELTRNPDIARMNKSKTLVTKHETAGKTGRDDW